jgi:redox-sensitive bicupin YhaK (pirin superfamily)
MHEHNNDEILSYMWRGTMLHEDAAGHRIPISANKLMMMNAGKNFGHEERTADEPVEMLQIFVRPCEADLPASVNFYDRHDAPGGAWSLVAGPEGSKAPLTIRNAVRGYDTSRAGTSQSGQAWHLPTRAQARSRRSRYLQPAGTSTSRGQGPQVHCRGGVR